MPLKGVLDDAGKSDGSPDVLINAPYSECISPSLVNCFLRFWDLRMMPGIQPLRHDWPRLFIVLSTVQCLDSI
jgi:hypothetical protein